MEPSEGTTPGTSGPDRVSTRLKRIAELAKKAPRVALTTLAHHIDTDFLRVAWALTRKDGATGIDGQTADSYEKNLEGNLHSLLERFKSGTYKAPPVKRVYIPKSDGKSLRPLGVPTFEDKVLQRAVAMVLEAVYEQEFRDCSYGFRPGRSAHQALDALRNGLMEMHGGIVLELDIQDFFGSLDHPHLRAFLDQRIRDGVLRRAIDKWLAAGVLEDGMVHHPESGSPQGGVVSPILSQIFLHEVLDVWFEDVVKPRLKGPAFLIRYADDAVLAFAHEDDAKRVMDVLPKRFGKDGLTLHPTKTRLVKFRRPSIGGGRGPGPGSFDFLGFTHYWGKSLKGNGVVRKKTARSRLTRAIKAVRLWLRRHFHEPIDDQHVALTQKLQGHYGYYGVTGNLSALWSFRRQVERAWRYWLNRRSQHARMFWPRFTRLLSRLTLPDPRIVHRAPVPAANP